ncbi:amino acid deaminase [Microbacterium sp. H1-D42]|uniref:amino acid deaminase n=1 Tax=Microbacterium sp. H1-D42 TaxID=2925844 RepID=UPI001F5346CE|nr:amino acid deaminase [Microbacterium sp. H1-D42]UNK70354.1 amino acid deaminase [Microbacterium sp. H1-D42]
MQTSAPQPPDLAPVLDLIAQDARQNRFSRWGTSTVIDENTGEPVIDRPLFDALHAAAGLDAQYPIGNAGVIHVYGYWFSTALTPYGYKRDRWQNGELAAALGQPETRFHLFSDPTSTPLQRVTAATLPLLRQPPTDAKVAGAQVDGLDTRVVLVAADGITADRLAANGSSICALIYGIRRGEDWQLITTFPLAGDPDVVVADFLADRRLRWNAAPQRDL